MKSPTAAAVRWWRWTRQSFTAKAGDAATILARSGWMRSVGGAGPYLGLFARGGLLRSDVDAALERLEIHELPSARGCTYLVPACDYAVALRAGQGQSEAAALATAKKYLGVTDREIDRLCARIVEALGRGPADPAELKQALGDAVRHLGEAGKKRGQTTTLPLGLGRLQSAGEIRRVPIDGRIDSQRYRYARWQKSPLAKVTLDEAALARELATRFYRWAAPATTAQLSWWSALGVKVARATVAELGLVPLGDGDERLMFADDLDELRAARPPKQLPVALVGSLDNLFHPRREVASMLDEDDAALKLPRTNVALGGLADLEDHAIVAGGQIVGLWQYDTAAQKIVYVTFGKLAEAAKKDVAKAVERMERFVREELGDARSFSLDSPESRKPRLAAMRALSC